jgi:hypothetical protein
MNADLQALHAKHLEQSIHERIETRRCSILPAGNFLLEEKKVWKEVSTLTRISATAWHSYLNFFLL